MPIVLENLKHDDDRVRLAVVRLLVEGRTLLPRIGPELESLLTADRDGVASHAAYLLGKSGPDAAPRLLNALRHPESRIDSIAGALAQVGRPAVALLSKAIEDPEPRVRRGSALALGQIRPLAPDAAKRLTLGLADPDPEVRAAFLTAIGGLGPRAADSVPAVRGLLRDASPEIRGRAVEVLFHSAPRDEQLLGDLRSLLDDTDPGVERRAIDALRDLGPMGRETLPLVIARLDSPDPDVRFAAAQMVESHGPAGVSAVRGLVKMLGDATPRNRAIAAATLGKFGKDAQAAFPGLMTLLEEADAATREAAISAIGSLQLDAETVRPALAKALRDDKVEVRRAATRGITRLGPSGAILVPDIILMAARKENARSVDRLLRPFERTGPDPRSIPDLLKLVENDQIPVRLLAIKFLGLGGRNAREALPTLERLRDDPSAEIRQQAKSACDQIQKTLESDAKA
jgi:HEAT repeat protein